MKNKKILISGAGVAGPTLAYWLKEYGFEPTVVEIAPKLRDGGYIIDFWGSGYDVAEKMDMIPDIKKASYPIQEITFINENGDSVGKLALKNLRLAMNNRIMSLKRSALSSMLYDKTKNAGIEYIFGDSIEELSEGSDGVTVKFKSGTTRDFDLVVGADGLHSTVRKLVFGDGSKFENYYGYYVAAFSTENFIQEDLLHDCKNYTQPGKQIILYSTEEGQITLLFTFYQEEPLKYDYHNLDEQKEILDKKFRDAGWRCERLMDEMKEVENFYFDSVSQVVMPNWSKGRCVLLGDAAFCPSLLSGQGAALAMSGAYVLAGELKEADGDFEKAFQNYQEIFKDFVTRKQNSAKAFANSFVPKTRFKVWLRNKLSIFLNIPFFSRVFLKKYLEDRINLKDY